MRARGTRRSWRALSGLALVLAAAAMFLSAWLFTTVQQERTDSAVSACMRESSRSAATIEFLEELGSRPATLEKARAFFPVLSREQCEARADESVGPPPVKK